MAAPETPRLRSRGDAPALPLDLVHDILLRLPAADACRLRAVCRPWRALLSDPLFAAAHAARHTDPLMAVGYAVWHGGDRVLCDIVDLSGRVVKRVRAGPGSGQERVLCAHLDHLIVATGSSMSCHLLNLATGAVHALPEGLAAELAEHRQAFLDCRVSAAFGMVPSTGKYKVLRVLRSLPYHRHPIGKLYEVLTINGSRRGRRWRAKKAPPYPVELCNNWYSVVIQHTVYFLLTDYNPDDHDKQGLVASFDLESEKWGARIPAPMGSSLAGRLNYLAFKIAALGDENLVLGRRRSSFEDASPFASMDLWLLMRDSGKSLWVKQHSIQTSELHVPRLGRPSLLVFNDEGTAKHVGNWSFSYCPSVSLYRGNLLSLANGSKLS